MKISSSSFAMLLLLASPIPFSDSSSAQTCASSPAPCNVEECLCTYCFGPENTAISPSIGPKTCRGDIVVTLSGLYWNATQEGMEYAITNDATIPIVSPDLVQIQSLNNLIDARYNTFPTHWEFGYKLGLGYTTPCDGWDLQVGWLRFKNFTSSHVEASAQENQTPITLWSAFSPAQGSVNYAREIEASWKLSIDILDFELGRAFWESKRLSMRPHIGIRYATISQELSLAQKGGSWSPRMNPNQNAFNNFVDIDNDYKGAGILTGIDTLWHLGCGWGIYAQCAGSLLYGRFQVNHEEENQLAVSPYSKQKVLETKEHFRASRGILDMAIGVEWSALFCGCDYGLSASIGWEHHLFFHQNQMWRVTRADSIQLFFLNNNGQSTNNNSGQNTFDQRRGTLSTQGWTLTLRFDF